MWEEAVNRECLSDLAQLVLDYENDKMLDSEFRMLIIDRIYELDEPSNIVEGKWV